MPRTQNPAPDNSIQTPPIADESLRPVREYVAREFSLAQSLPHQNLWGGSKSRIANTGVNNGLETTMYAALVLSGAWRYAACTPPLHKP